MKAYKKFKPQKRGELDLLFYEIWMLNGLEVDQAASEIQSNANLESFLMHARNLIDFLENNKNKSDDLTCINFLDKRGKQITPLKVGLPRKTKEQVNKHISHLTTRRLREKIKWDITRFRRCINTPMRAFIRQLPPDYFPTSKGQTKEGFEKLIHDR